MIEKGYLEAFGGFRTPGTHSPCKQAWLPYHRPLCTSVYWVKSLIIPNAVFTEAILKPETQDMEVFVDGIDNIVEAQRNVARQYIDDGSIEDACPPLHALLHIMAEGEYQGMNVRHPEIRKMFTRDYLLQSDWYQESLKTKQERESRLWQRHVSYLESFINKNGYADVVEEMKIADKLAAAHQRLSYVQSDDYLVRLEGTLGADTLESHRHE